MQDIIRDIRSRLRRLEARPWVVGPTTSLFVQTSDMVVGNTTLEQPLLGVGVGSLIVTAGTLVTGRTIQVAAQGQISTVATPSLNLQVKLGTHTIASTGARTLVAVTGKEWYLSVLLTCRQASTSGLLVGGGLFEYNEGIAIALPSNLSVSLDTTVELPLAITATWGTAHVSNIITLRKAVVTSMYPL